MSSDLLDRKVSIDFFGHRKRGRICSVSRVAEEIRDVEVEWGDGTMTRPPFGKLQVEEVA